MGRQCLVFVLLSGLILPINGMAGAIVSSGTILVDSAADDQPAGACTLRQAIALLNGTGDTGTCQATGTVSPPEIHFDLTLPATITLDAGLGQLNAGTSMRIVGPGMEALTVSGGNAVRVFEGTTGGALLALQDLRVSEGLAPPGSLGGGIALCCGHELTLDRVHVFGNHSEFSGGGINAGAAIVVRDSIIEANTAVNDAAGTFVTYGGGVNVEGFGGEARFERVHFLDNIAGSLVSGADPGVGGALNMRNSRAVTIIDSVLSGNEARGAQQRLNFNPLPGGLGGQGGAVFAAVGLTLIGSTVSDNQASFQGGGVINIGTTRIINSTIAGNTVPGAASPSQGGGLFNTSNSGSLELTNATVYGNSAGSGGGLYNERSDGQQVVLNNAAFGEAGSGQPGGDVVNGGSGALSGQNTLVESAGAAGGLADGVDGNIVGSPAGFTGLGANGGQTPTVALAAGSALIDAGNNALAVDQNSDPLLRDQRNLPLVPRVIGGTVDIGALEYAGGLMFLDRFEAAED